MIGSNNHMRVSALGIFPFHRLCHLFQQKGGNPELAYSINDPQGEWNVSIDKIGENQGNPAYTESGQA